jgi:hypothetical protein
MKPKILAILIMLLAVFDAPMAGFAKTTDSPAANRKAATHSSSPMAETPADAVPTPATDHEGSVRDYAPPQITVANPPPAPKVWTWQEQVAWGANLVLAILGYAGIMMAVSLLKKIDRQTGYAEAAAEAAAASAQAALLNAKALVHSERPWILISVEPSRGAENSFTVMATNRGRTPARITATADQAMIAVDERYLPIPPEYDKEESKPPAVPIILVPGESTPIKPFRREEVKALCGSEERFRRIETWEDKLYLYGNVTYADLISTPDDQIHETNWCCWYIHGRQNSGLVIAGPAEYNSHT